MSLVNLNFILFLFPFILFVQLSMDSVLGQLSHFAHYVRLNQILNLRNQIK